MKIALLTIWHCGNYGAELQAYATYKALVSLGHEVELIDFPLWGGQRKSLKLHLADFIGRISPAEKKFRQFWGTYIPHATRIYWSAEDLRQNPPKADMYVVGSDQVWNTSITRGLAASFFLDFGPEEVKRFSFSSSFGVSNWDADAELTEIATKRLHSFVGVSCRESVGIEILRDTFKVAGAVHTADPTLLHPDYGEITGAIKEQPTLAYYPLAPNDIVLEKCCKEMANRLHLRLMNANPYTFIPDTSFPWNRNSISEWLKTIGEAQFVITPSFHGVALSLIQHRQFAVLYLEKHGRQSRIIGLLKQLGLSDRFFDNFEELKKSDVFYHPIDYSEIDKKLDVLRKTSWDYLKSVTVL